MNESPMAGRAVFLPALLPAALFFSAMPGIALAGFFILRDGIEWLGAGLLMFGSLGTIAFFMILVCEFSGQASLLNEHIARAQTMTARMQPMLAPSLPVPLEVRNVTYSERGFAGAQIKRYDNPPPKDFVEWVIETAWGEGTRGRRVPERIAAEAAKRNPLWGASYNAWLGMLEEQKILQREHDAENAPRRWADDMTPNNALARFGYADPMFLTHSPTAPGMPGLR